MSPPHLQCSARFEETSESERTYATFIHLAGMLSLLDHMFLGLIATFIMWRVRKDESPYIDDHCREVINFGLSILVYLLVGGLFVGMTFGLGAFVFVPMIFALWIVRLVAGIRGAMAANRGQRYRYPICIRFIAEPV